MDGGEKGKQHHHNIACHCFQRNRPHWVQGTRKLLPLPKCAKKLNSQVLGTERKELRGHEKMALKNLGLGKRRELRVWKKEFEGKKSSVNKSSKSEKPFENQGFSRRSKKPERRWGRNRRPSKGQKRKRILSTEEVMVQRQRGKTRPSWGMPTTFGGTA